jgi:DNA-binding Lrp family transcriptional regulator
MANYKTKDILNLLEKQRVISIKELLVRLQEVEPDLAHSTLKWRIYSLKEQGLIKNIGRGLYSLGSNLPVFRAPVTKKIRLINNVIKVEFPYLNFSIWSTQWLSDYMLHQPMSHIILVDVDPDASTSVFNKLKDKWRNTKVLYKPTAEEFDRYAVGVQNLVIVKDLISEAPIEKVDGISVPMLEKIIVDIYTEKNIFAAFNGSEISIIFNEIDSKYLISRTKLLRYARRRSAQKLLDLLKILPEEVQGAVIDNK